MDLEAAGAGGDRVQVDRRGEAPGPAKNDVGRTGILATAAGLALIAIGSSLFTGRGVLFSIVRQFAITASAAAITYGVGAWLGGIIGR